MIGSVDDRNFLQTLVGSDGKLKQSRKLANSREMDVALQRPHAVACLVPVSAEFVPDKMLHYRNHDNLLRDEPDALQDSDLLVSALLRSLCTFDVCAVQMHSKQVAPSEGSDFSDTGSLQGEIAAAQANSWLDGNKRLLWESFGGEYPMLGYLEKHTVGNYSAPVSFESIVGDFRRRTHGDTRQARVPSLVVVDYSLHTGEARPVFTYTSHTVEPEQTSAGPLAALSRRDFLRAVVRPYPEEEQAEDDSDGGQSFCETLNELTADTDDADPMIGARSLLAVFESHSEWVPQHTHPVSPALCAYLANGYRKCHVVSDSVPAHRFALSVALSKDYSFSLEESGGESNTIHAEIGDKLRHDFHLRGSKGVTKSLGTIFGEMAELGADIDGPESVVQQYLANPHNASVGRWALLWRKDDRGDAPTKVESFVRRGVRNHLRR